MYLIKSLNKCRLHNNKTFDYMNNQTNITKYNIETIIVGSLTSANNINRIYFRQPTLWLQNLCLKILTVMVIRLKALPLQLLMSRIWYSIDTTFNIFSYDAILVEIRTYLLPEIMKSYAKEKKNYHGKK